MRIISEQELIITPRGTVYHLGLDPSQIADTIITVGDSDRVGEVSKYFDRIECSIQNREFITHTGYLGSKRISVISTGIGAGAIDIVMNELDALVNVDFVTRKVKDTKTNLSIIRMGTCGAVQEDIPLNSIIVSSYAIGLDNLLHFYQHYNDLDEGDILNAFKEYLATIGYPCSPYLTTGDKKIESHFSKGFLSGITISCPGFYAPQARELRLPIRYSELLNFLAQFSYKDLRVANVEMETSAIYGLGKILGHKCLSLSTVLTNRMQGTFSKDTSKAIERMIKHSLEIIATL